MKMFINMKSIESIYNKTAHSGRVNAMKLLCTLSLIAGCAPEAPVDSFDGELGGCEYGEY